MERANDLCIINAIIEKILAAKKIAITGHINPDGDAVASCLAIALSINSLGKEPVVLLESFPSKYSFLKGREFVRTDGFHGYMPDLFIACDCADVERMGEAKDVFYKSPKKIVIDHHISNSGYGDIDYIKPMASSASELVYDIIDALGNMDENIAAALYTGIIFDTGGLRFPATSPETIIKIAKLMEYDIPFSELYGKTMLIHTFEGAMVFSRAIRKMKFVPGFPIVYTIITQRDLEELNGNKDNTDGIVEYLLNTQGAEIAVFIYEVGINKSKASFRSKGFDMCKVAINWGGGGHTNAAGATINLSPERALGEVLDFLKTSYNS